MDALDSRYIQPWNSFLDKEFHYVLLGKRMCVLSAIMQGHGAHVCVRPSLNREWIGRWFWSIMYLQLNGLGYLNHATCFIQMLRRVQREYQKGYKKSRRLMEEQQFIKHFFWMNSSSLDTSGLFFHRSSPFTHFPNIIPPPLYRWSAHSCRLSASFYSCNHTFNNWFIRNGNQL